MTLIYDDWGRSALTDAILQKQTQKALNVMMSTIKIMGDILIYTLPHKVVK